MAETLRNVQRMKLSINRKDNLDNSYSVNGDFFSIYKHTSVYFTADKENMRYVLLCS